MGYSEIYCHLCGVSFNIARSRRVDEPYTAAWDYTGSHAGPMEEPMDWYDCAKNDCSYAVLAEGTGSEEEDDDPVNDPDYDPEEENMYEPYEYDSDHETVDDMMLDEPQEDNVGENQDRDLESQWYSDWLSTLPPPEKRVGEPIWISDQPQKKYVCFPVPKDGDMLDIEQAGPVEHIPGPNCTSENAYSGRKISLQEMRGCRTVQCLIHKGSTERWMPDALEQDWELSGDYFLSGLCDGMPSRDMCHPRVYPAKGGVLEPRAENVTFDDYEDPNVFALPFHPSCFDIFSRLSKRHFHHLNLTGLMKWRNTEFSYEDFHEFPRDGDVLSAQEQFWLHEPGKEYLAANPLYIPNLPPLLLAAIKEDEDFTSSIRAFDPSRPKESSVTTLETAHQSTDPLLSLPNEIRLMVVEYLGSRDIANLRLVSRAFHQLPVSLWYRLVREEMPWLWEAWEEGECAHTPSFWTAATANEIHALSQISTRYMMVLGEEYPDGELGSEAIEKMVPLTPEVPPQIKLPRGKTNWYELYTEIKRNWSDLKGLRNRKRIWEDVEEIITRIKKYED
ncbi:hypothetical protein BBP40_002383 [Aspergillus hancockii]|nr:hypothetical protein BBP40_002383 [Aspergillus hancockii]